MKKNNTAVLLDFVAAVLTVSILFTSCQSTGTPKDATEKGFVTVHGDKFMLNNEEFRFMGSNNYYMHYCPDQMVTDVLDDAQDMGVTVLRIWGFQYGPNKDHNAYGLNTPAKDGNPGTYGIPENKKATTKNPDEFGYPRDIFQRLDYTIAEAGKRGIKLVIPMINYWDPYGGVMNSTTWQSWFNLANPDDFYTDKECQKAYKEYVNHLITRVNSITGIPYNEDPTIMTWELMNEPRNSIDKSGKTVTAWAKAMSKYVKSLAPYQLCSAGDEGFLNLKDFTPIENESSYVYSGFQGEDYAALLRLKNIDYGTFHLYPESWGVKESLQEAWGNEYITKHAEIANEIGKPCVFEEYGVLATGNQNRTAVYDSWNKTAYDKGVNGSMYWILTSSNIYEKTEGGDGIYDDYDGFRILNDDSKPSTVLRDYAKLFTTGISSNYLKNSRVYLLSPAKDQNVKGTYEVRAKFMQGVESNSEVKRAWLYINGEKAPSPYTMNYNRKMDTYRINFDTVGRVKEFPEGSKLAIKVVFLLEDGTQMETEENTITITNQIKYSEFKKYDFAEGTANASSMGAYMAELKKISHSDLNGGMLQIDCAVGGNDAWQELKVKFGSMSEVADAAKLDFTIYFEKDAAVANANKSDTTAKLPGVQSYIAFDPGWVKTGQGENNSYLQNLEIVTLEDGKKYYKQVVKEEFFQNPEYTFVTICPTFGYVKYEGPLYIDDITLYKKE